MRIGIFARTFTEPSLQEVLNAVTRHGIELVHFNLSCVGLETLPPFIDDDLCALIRCSFEQRKLQMVAISGTYNMIHPNLVVRQTMLERGCLLIKRAADLGTRFVTVCTGTRNSDNMWLAHDENNCIDAWRDLIDGLEKLLSLAEAKGVTIGIEPEKGNVVNSAMKARRLLNQMASKNLMIVMDGANLIHSNEMRSQRDILLEAFDLLGPNIAMVHAKEIADGENTNEIGKGQLDWKTYFQCVSQIGSEIPIILHNLAASQVHASVRFVTRHFHSPRHST